METIRKTCLVTNDLVYLADIIEQYKRAIAWQGQTPHNARHHCEVLEGLVNAAEKLALDLNRWEEEDAEKAVAP